MKRLGNILCTVIPWTFFWAGRAWSKPAWGILGALASMGCVWFLTRHRMKAPDWTQLLFFILVLGGMYFAPLAWAPAHQALLAPGLFTIMAFGSLLLGLPFTVEYAHEEVPAEFWQDPGFPPHFARVNKILTWLWAMVFALSLFCAWLAPHAVGNWPWLLQVLPPAAFVAATLITRFFPLWYQKNFYEPCLPGPKLA